LDGLSVRVPTPNGSLTDLTAELHRDVTVEEINAAFAEAATNCSMSPYLEYTEEPIVLADIVGNPASCIFDALTTNVVGGNLVKVLGWYDNEWGYANRCVEVAERMG
jgi:glyceraldehyde 3-phosphate dehydrogenase